MNDQKNEYEIQRKRKYHREWREKHPESVRAAQMRYWAKQMEKVKAAAAIPENAEIRQTAR